MNRWIARLRELTQSTFVLTSGERKAVCIVLGLALLGLGVKCWHTHQDHTIPAEKSLAR